MDRALFHAPARALLALSFVSLGGLAAGCDLFAHLDEYHVRDGGAGGEATTSTSGTTTTSAGDDTSTSTTTTSTGHDTSTSTTTSTATTSTGPSTCDNTGDCGDSTRGCAGCAAAGPCADSYDACIREADCIAYAECITGCGSDQACNERCVTDHPVGRQVYETFVHCVICDVCTNDCNGAASGCP